MDLRNIEKYAVRLEGLPWKWVAASKVFTTTKQLLAYAVLSKDAPDTLAIAVDLAGSNDGYMFINLDLSNQDVDDCYVRWSDTEESYHVWIDRIWIPLGFALDVRAWIKTATGRERMHTWDGLYPSGYWVDFADLTRDMEDGGDGDRWFSAYFVGPCWWIVDWHDELIVRMQTIVQKYS